MKKTKKALASLAIAGMALTMVPFNVFAAGTVPTRLAGTTAEQTAVQIADQTGYTGTAILASSASYGAADALTAGPLASFLKAPILLQGAGTVLNADTKAELTKLAIKTVYVTSGTAVISQAVIDQIKGMGITVESLGGNDRFETSVNIAKKLVALGAPVKKVAVAYGWLNQDALSIAAVASAANEPIILTEKAGLSASAQAFLAANLGITASDVIGGTGVIDATVLAQLPSPTRHFGNTAYDTNNQVIQDFASSLNFGNVYLANGVTGIDALSGAPLAAMTKSAIVLTDGVNVPAAATFTYSKSTASTVVTALGGAAVVPEQVRLDVAAGKVTVAPGDLAIVSVSALDNTNKFLKVVFAKPVYNLQPANIVIKDDKKGDLFGVNVVTLASDGLSATLELFENTESDMVLAENTVYDVTINANGSVLTSTFFDAAFSESRIVDINVADKEFTAVDEKKNAPKVIKVPTGVAFDYEAALGEVVRVWYNDDNELVKAELQTTSAVFGGIKIKDENTITVLSTGKDYDLSTEVYTGTTTEKSKFYVNGAPDSAFDAAGDFTAKYQTGALPEQSKYNYAKIGFNKSGDVEYIGVYNLSNFLVVNKVDGDEVVGIEGQSGGSFDAEDATIVKDGKVIALSDIKAGDVMFFNNDADGGDGFAVVYNKTVTGEIENVYSSSIEVGGKTYNYIYDATATATPPFQLDYAKAVYLDDGDLAVMDSDAAEELQAGGDVTLYLDPAGNLVYVSGDTAVVDSNKVSAVLADNISYDTAFNKDQIQVDAVLPDGTEKIQTTLVEDLDTITINGTSYDIDNTDTDATNDKYVVDVDPVGVIGITQKVAGAAVVYSGAPIDLDSTKGTLVTLHSNDQGVIKEIEFFTATTTDQGTVTSTDVLESGDTYFVAAVGGSKKLKSDTVVFDATDGVGVDDVNVTTWGAYKGSDIAVGAKAVYNKDNEVVALVYTATTSSDKVYNEAVLTKVLINTDSEIVSIDAFVDGKKVTLEVDKLTDSVTKGDVVVLGFDDNNSTLVNAIYTKAEIAAQGTPEIVAAFDAGYIITGQTIDTAADTNGFTDGVNVGERKIALVGGAIYKLVSDGSVINNTDITDITVEALSDLRSSVSVTVIKDEKDGSFAKYFVYQK